MCKQTSPSPYLRTSSRYLAAREALPRQPKLDSGLRSIIHGQTFVREQGLQHGDPLEGEYILTFPSQTGAFLTTQSMASMRETAVSQYGVQDARPYSINNFRAFHVLGDNAKVAPGDVSLVVAPAAAV